MTTRLFAVLAFLATAACSAQVPPPAPQFQAGRDYAVIEPPQATASGDKIEVIEVFGYSCVHCAHFDPLVEEWKKKLPADVSFNYMPAVFGGVWEIFGQAFYAAETMGLLEQTHSALFKAIHSERRPFQSEDDVAAFYAGFGIDKAQFLGMMKSFAVTAKIARAKQQVPRYGVEGTPSMIVNGKYRIAAQQEGGFPRMLQVADFLIAQERAARQTSG